MFVRMKKNPLIYGITINDLEADPQLRNWRYVGKVDRWVEKVDRWVVVGV